MHIISKDFQSSFLKNKKHWNSFNSPFFIPIDSFIQQLEEKGFISFSKEKYEEFLNQTMKCPKCSQSFSTIPKMKQHYATCFNSFTK